MQKKQNLTPVKELTISQILSTENPRAWTDRELSRYVRTLNLAANKRLARLKKTSKSNPITVSDKGLFALNGRPIQKFTNKKRTADETTKQYEKRLFESYDRASAYLKRKSTTITGAMEIQERAVNKIMKRIRPESELRDNLTKELIENSYSLFRKLRETNYAFLISNKTYSTNDLLEDIGSKMLNYNEESVNKYLQQKINKTYEKLMEKELSDAEQKQKDINSKIKGTYEDFSSLYTNNF